MSDICVAAKILNRNIRCGGFEDLKLITHVRKIHFIKTQIKMWKKLKKIVKKNEALSKKNKKKNLYTERLDPEEPDELFDSPKTSLEKKSSKI